MEVLGFTAEDVAVDQIEVWPDNWRSVLLFNEMQTQWRVGPCGPTGLDYGVLFELIRLKNFKQSKAKAVFEDIRILEAAALNEMARG